ncbi:MAG: hypothetical protein NDJ94_18960 [Vicinamibacteria bacterium]|nr:hypothetical protein [Vicinamibacteria bacterium]
MSRAAALAVVLLCALLANGRSIGAGDTRANEYLAASLAGDGDVFLDEYPEVTDPFARTVGGRRVSIYPPLSSALAAPLFALARPFVRPDEAAFALLGKLTAALLVALSAAVLSLAMARRGHAPRMALGAAALFALGTSAWSVSQALWQHPAALLFLSAALYCLVRAEEDDAWAARAGLPLGLALAARHADVAVVLVLAAATALRYPKRAFGLFLHALPAAAFQFAYGAIAFGAPLGHGFGGAGARFAANWSESLPGLLFSPARGLFVFTPLAALALAGAVRELRGPRRGLAASGLAAALAHLLLVGCWSEWHGGDSFGPRLLCGLLPPLFLFLPEGLRLAPRLGAVAAVASVAVQALGAFAYDTRWDRLHRDDFPAALWSWRDGPLAFQMRAGVVILARPRLEGERVVFRELRRTPLGPVGDTVEFAAGGLVVSGERGALCDVHLLRGARVAGPAVELHSNFAGIGFRLREAEPDAALCIEGEGQGTLYVSEASAFDRPRWTSYEVAGPFVVSHPRSAAHLTELTIGVGRGGGTLRLWRVRLPRACP